MIDLRRLHSYERRPAMTRTNRSQEAEEIPVNTNGSLAARSGVPSESECPMTTLDLQDAEERDVGTVAQDLFKVWCSQAKVVANPVQNDKKGWDFIVEYGVGATAWRADQITCKVQVKGTESGAT
ncbi:MAG: hypothetical protein R2939_01895 [Kofleriaceae bacterium]